PLQDFSPDGGTVTYTVSFTLNGTGTTVNGEVGVTMPPGARYVTHSTALRGGPGSIDGEPILVQAQNKLTWQFTGVELGTSYQLTFNAKPGLSLGTESASASIDAFGLAEPVDTPNPAATLIPEPGEPGNA